MNLTSSALSSLLVNHGFMLIILRLSSSCQKLNLPNALLPKKVSRLMLYQVAIDNFFNIFGIVQRNSYSLIKPSFLFRVILLWGFWSNWGQQKCTKKCMNNSSWQCPCSHITHLIISKFQKYYINSNSDPFPCCFYFLQYIIGDSVLF